jgi:hypothetical protein
MGHEPYSNREQYEQVGQHDEITSMTSSKIVGPEEQWRQVKDLF